MYRAKRGNPTLQVYGIWRAGVRALLYLTCVYVLTGVIIMRRLWLHEACVKKL